MFCLYYDNQNRSVSCVNGSGCSPAGLNMDVLRRDCSNEKGEVDPDKFKFSAHAVTVPGAARGYEDVLHRHGSGKFTLAELVEPAAKLAEEGFPVAPITSHHWRSGMSQIKAWLEDGEPVPLSKDGKEGPQAGDVMTNPDLAKVLRDLGKCGSSKGFYEGSAGQAIVHAVQVHGGTMTLEDMASHSSTFPNPIAATYRGIQLWQVPPNGQGVAGLIALSGLEHLEKQGLSIEIAPETVGKADSYHVMIEMMRLGFSDARNYVTDLNQMPVSCEWLLDPKRIGERAEQMFNRNKAVVAGSPLPSSCTVSFQVVDSQGNAISFVNSNFMGFGTGIVPKGCGFSLQNRGFGFSTDSDHPNLVAPKKRPYHTIIPGMLTYADTNELYATISNMGGNMQPQGHLQLTVGMVAGGLDPQAAIDFPRFCIVEGTKEGYVSIEDGVDDDVIKSLKEKGHCIIDGVIGHDRSIMGRAQIIKRDRKTGVLWAGSDGRADGCAMGY